MSLLQYLMITNYYLDIQKGVSYTNYTLYTRQQNGELISVRRKNRK